MKTKERISDFVDSLIAEGQTVLGTEWKRSGRWVGCAPRYVDLQKFKKWRASCNLLVSLIGELTDPWSDFFKGDASNKLVTAISMQGVLQAIRKAIDSDLLIRFEDLVFAEAFSDLLKQAEYLFDQGYFLACGVILRAVLEERLNRMCERYDCKPIKVRPTIADYNIGLYKAKVYDKITLKQVESMAVVGNDAAHNKPNLQKVDVERFRTELTAFLQKFAT